jgi:hypothetical protein
MKHIIYHGDYPETKKFIIESESKIVRVKIELENYEIIETYLRENGETTG